MKRLIFYHHVIKKIMTTQVFAVLTALTVPIFAPPRAAGLERQGLQTALDQVLDRDSTARRTTVALKVVDVATSEVLYERHGDRLFTPASNLKIYTSK